MSEGRWPLSRTFFNKVSIGGSDVCWEWRGAKTKGGYGQIQRYPRGQKKKVVYAHRMAYEMATKTRLAGETHLHLYALWLFLHTVFDGIDQWHAASRERREVSTANQEKRTSDS